MIYIVQINDTEYEVEVEQGKAEIVRTAAVEAPQATAIAIAPATPVASVQATPAATAAGETVTAPMPGTILSVAVSVGTKVTAGQTLLILEAMKMENEIAAPKDGTVTQIITSKGTAVATGDALVIID